MADLNNYAFWRCDEGEGNTITSEGDHVIDLDLVGNDPWDNADQLTLDGATCFTKTWANLSASEKTFLTLGEGIIITWAQVECVTAEIVGASGETVLLGIGKNGGTNNGCIQQRMTQIDSGSPPLDGCPFRIRVRNDTETYNLNGGQLPVDEERVYMTVFDGRTGRKNVYIYRDRYPWSGNTLFSSIGEMIPTDGGLTIGAGYNFANALEGFFFSRVKNVGIANLGTSLPRGIDALLQDILLNNGVPEGLR